MNSQILSYINPPSPYALRGLAQALRSRKRIVALYGTFQQVKEALESALPYRRRGELIRTKVVGPWSW